MIEKVAIANRGEVAVRIIRACQEMGLETVLLHSEADMSTKAYRIADQCICIGPASVQESYLNIQANIDGAIAAGADAIHPGFGFLSENAEFARACENNRLIFIGPSAESIELFGDKISAKKLVQTAGGPVIPGYQGDDQSFEHLKKQADQIGYPLMVKAAAGGGGRGLRVVYEEGQFQSALESAQREGLNSFGSSQVFLEKYLNESKHIEVQIFADAKGEVFHLYDRECSVQRRHQKVIEEAVTATLDENTRQEICNTAVKIAKQAGYKGAGTVEFLYEKGEFYFLEMNTRLQVEHPVTELVLGVDLVKAQILTAQNKAVTWKQEDLKPRGHSIECRLYAEDAYSQGVPSTGRLGYLYWPDAPGRRFDVGFEINDEVTSYYDPMLAKVIVWDETRPRAIQKMIQTLKETVVFGVKTNIPYLIELLSHPEFVNGTMTTRFIDTYFPKGLEAKEFTEDDVLIAKQIAKKTKDSHKSSDHHHPSPWISSWGES